MYFKFFAIPKAVYYYCLLPILILIITSLIFLIVYHRKKDTYYYEFTVNYFLGIIGILLASLLFSLLLGYSLATIYTIFVNELVAKYYVFMIILFILPLIPLSLFIWVMLKIGRNLKYKKELDENYEEYLKSEQQKVEQENENE